MENSTAQHCHYLNKENVPLSVAVCETLTACDRSLGVTEESPLGDYLDVEAVDTLFTKSIVRDEGAALSLQLTLPDVCVDVHAEAAHPEGPVHIEVTETRE